MRTLVPAATCVLLVLVLSSWSVALLRAPLNVDAGLYLPVARDMARGQVLYRDLPCDYPPVAFEILSLLGPRGLSTPPVVKAVWLLVHASNALLLFLVLRRWRYRRDMAWFSAIVFATWTMALDGTAIALEPLVNFFLLLAMMSMDRAGRLTRGLTAGLLFGAALMVKQYALLSLPGMLLLLMFPRGKYEASEPRNEDTEHSLSGETADGIGQVCMKQAAAAALLFLIAIPVPVVLYALFNGLNVTEFISHMATFGDRIGRYEVLGWRGFFVGLTSGGAASALSVYLVLTSVLMVIGRRGYHVALACGLLATCGALYVRDYPHYVQLPALWAVLVAIEFAAILARKLAIARSRAVVVLLILTLPLVPRCLASVGVTYRMWRDDAARSQAAVAKEVAAALPERSDGWVINAPWLYVLADLEAPEGDYRFVDQGIFSDQSRGDKTRQWLKTVPRFVVFAPGVIPAEDVFPRLAEAGFQPLVTIKQANQSITVLEHSPEASNRPR